MTQQEATRILTEAIAEPSSGSPELVEAIGVAIAALSENDVLNMRIRLYRELREENKRLRKEIDKTNNRAECINSISGQGFNW